MIFELQDGRVEVGAGDGCVLLEHAELWLERGEHVSLVGPNGAGKTTLIETLAGAPRARRRASCARATTCKVGYLSQHAERARRGRAPGQSVLEAAQRATGLTPNKARALLGRFLFSGEEAREAARGAVRRRAPAAVAGDPRRTPAPNVLILDEPTNHLDIESREALEDALRAFAGAVLLVSHDRALLDAVGTRTVAVEDGSLHSYVGGWPEYVRVREERRASGDGVASARRPPCMRGRRRVRPTARRDAPPAARRGAERAATRREAGKRTPKPEGPVEEPPERAAEGGAAVEEAEAAMRALEEELADPAAWATQYESAKSEARHTAARRAVEDAYARLEALVD